MPHPTIPIPADARVGDIVWFRDGQRKAITGFSPAEDIISVFGSSPSWVLRNRANLAKNKWDCIGFQYADNRKPPIGAAKPAKPMKPAKPKPDADAEWLRQIARNGWIASTSNYTMRRFRKIAKRLENSK